MALEIDSHETRVASLTEQVENLSKKTETTPEQVQQIDDLHALLIAKWDELKSAIILRTQKLAHNEALQRLLFDVDNAEQWLTERELIAERPIKVLYAYKYQFQHKCYCLENLVRKGC